MRGFSRPAGPILILLFPLLFLGCTESSLFVPDLSEEEEPTVSTVEAGSVVEPEGSIPITLPEGSDGEYTSLEITVRTPEGEVVHSEVYDSVTLSEPVLPDLVLPQLEPGSYLVELLLFDQQREVAREESLFFITGAEISVSGITLYPPASETEAQLIAEAHIRNNDPTLDPYLRWRFRDEIVSEGLISEEGATARLATGTESGVFTLTVELFPYAPPEGLSYEIESTTSHTTDVVVRPQGEAETPSVPEDLHLAYRFDGHGRVQGGEGAEDDANWHPLGEPRLTLRDNVFGFRIDEDNGFSRSGFLFPLDDDERLLPFRLELTLSLISLGSDRSFLLATADGHREFLFGLSYDGTPWVTVDNGSNEVTVTAPAPALNSEELRTIAVDLYPGEEGSYLFFYEGETLLHEALLPLTLGASPGPASTADATTLPENLDGFRREGVATGSVILAGPKAAFVLDELVVRTLDERTLEQVPELYATLEGGAAVQLEVPTLQGETVRYRVHGREPGGELYLEAEEDDSRRSVATISDGERVVLELRNGELRFLLNGGDWTSLPGEAFFLRNGPESPEVDISKQSVAR
ncbi:MAG: hypothetical protein ACOC25_07265 [Alkalispirochaetaceae bacterium]